MNIIGLIEKIKKLSSGKLPTKKDLVKLLNNFNKEIKPKNIKIKFKNKEYWLMANSLKESGPITEIEKCDKNGNPIDYCSISYAYYYPNFGVSRYGKKICEVKDIKIINK